MLSPFSQADVDGGLIISDRRSMPNARLEDAEGLHDLTSEDFPPLTAFAATIPTPKGLRHQSTLTTRNSCIVTRSRTSSWPMPLSRRERGRR
jgi:hypothetical protein